MKICMNMNEKTNLNLRCDPSPTLIAAFKAKVNSTFAGLMFFKVFFFFLL